MGPPSFVLIDFNQPISFPNGLIRLKNLDTREDVTGPGGYNPADDTLRIFHSNFGTPTFECGTTYEVTVSGKGKRVVTSERVEPRRAGA